jgi:hypothetical protein
VLLAAVVAAVVVDQDSDSEPELGGDEAMTTMKQEDRYMRSQSRSGPSDRRPKQVLDLEYELR